MNEKSGEFREINNNELSKEKVVKLLFSSFRFSQGDINVQEKIFQWLHAQYPSYKVSESNIDEIKKDLLKKTKSYVLSPKGHHTQVRKTKTETGDDIPIDHGFIRKQVDNEASKFYNMLNSQENISIEQAVQEVARGIIEGDIMYLRSEEGGGRPNKLNPQMSQIVTYGLSAESTGVPEYNEMFKQVTDFVLNEFAKLRNGEETTIPHNHLANLYIIIEDRLPNYFSEK